ncbi:MAG: glycosyltransferase, partial [Eubacterium sp.]
MNTFYVFGSIILIVLLFYSLALKNTTAKRLFAFITLVTLFVYILWRGFFTLPLETPLSAVSGIILYLAEIVGLFVFAFFVFLFARQRPEVLQPPLEKSFRPKVCVFICTYNEDIKLVLATAHAAKVLNYTNKEIYICDDGHREQLRELCKKFDIHYLSRPDNAHAKAGNINYALSQTDSELFMVLDADFIVKQNFIYEAVSFFQDEEVALVQYPQSFYNKDPFQLMRGSLFNEQELFMRFQEPALAKENAMIHIGTNAILRRSAVEKIGGIPTKSITEDMATGLLLQNAGYKTRYINKAYALGITPYNVADLAAQRRRWARGTMQIFRSYKPFRLKGLGFLQKLCYFNSDLYWFSSFQKLVYMVAPTLFMLFQIFIVKSSLQEMLLFFLLPILMIMLSFR